MPSNHLSTCPSKSLYTVHYKENATKRWDCPKLPFLHLLICVCVLLSTRGKQHVE